VLAITSPAGLKDYEMQLGVDGVRNMQRRIWMSTFLLTGLFAVISTASNGQEAIGSATSVKPQAEANARTLSNGSSVY
jgi:hypothetical protein